MSPSVWAADAIRFGAPRSVIGRRNWTPSTTEPALAARGIFPPLQRTQVVALACRKPSELGLPLSTWSVRTLARKLVQDEVVTRIHYSSVCLILQEAECQPHRTLYWKQGHDPEFSSKAVHVLWYYENVARLAEKGEPVFCVDEKPGIQLLGRAHPDEPARPGCPLRREYEYIRHGTGLLLMFVNLLTGRIFTRTPSKKSGPDFTALLDEHLQTLSAAKRVHYVLDNDPTHTSAHTRAWLNSQKGRVCFHYTPKYASWLNQAEIALGNFSRYYLRRRVWSSANDFAPHIRTSTLHYNSEFAHPFDWSFTRNRFHKWMRSKTCSTGH
jgi:DDE superfamily endonuclease